MTMEDLKVELKYLLGEIDISELVYVHNCYCDDTEYGEDKKIYSVEDDFDWYFESYTPLQIAYELWGNDIINNYYFWIDVYGLRTNDYDLPISIADIVSWLVENYNSGNIYVEDALDECPIEALDLLDEFFDVNNDY